VGERSYLAIGDVLALLREEFPDVTISKIRFLESRGLLVPERTPSGYRKFYEQDVDRLRWILRQQREHFLPLKVIKGRLENGLSATEEELRVPALFEMSESSEAPAVGEARTLSPAGAPPEPALLVAAGAVGALIDSGDQVSEPSAGKDVLRSAGVSGGGPARPPGAPAPSHAPLVGAITGPRATSSRSSAPAADNEPPAVASRGRAGGSEPTRAPRRERASTESAKGANSAPGATPASGRDANSAPEATPAPARGATPRATAATPPSSSSGRGSTRSTTGIPGGAMSGASFTLLELASASGLQPVLVDQLESYGLITGRSVAGVRCYDEEALLVAKLSADFARFGIEARHLRMFKHAAERQAGMFAQVVTPLLRQRNPESRSKALEDLAELSDLGVSLMRCFAQATLRELTGG